MESGHLLTHSCLTLLEASLTVSPGFFCLLFRGFLFSLSVYNEAFYVHVASDFFCILVFCPTLGFYLVLFNLCVLFYNLSKYITLCYSYILSLLLLFFLHPLCLWSNFHYRITKLYGLVYCIILFFGSLKFLSSRHIVYKDCYFLMVINLHLVKKKLTLINLKIKCTF